MTFQAQTLSVHFLLSEFEASDTAIRLGIDNSVVEQAIYAELQKTAAMLERIRTELSTLRGRDMPIKITSGYRCKELNRALRSADTSDHIKGMAVDWSCANYGTPQDISKLLAPKIDALGIGQLIFEFGTWIHCSTRRPAENINRVITIDRQGTRAGIQDIRP